MADNKSQTPRVKKGVVVNKARKLDAGKIRMSVKLYNDHKLLNHDVTTITKGPRR